ncbi:asparaginyl-tRNA synthetase [Dothidotthia symphoricarpi CBS 119687]|uniref:asparagine--tRNA ligase n=1 Tax=Dothidotthia symphoricarpi CBS 119687 TaxID=1392245 RepID=A0A6A6AGA6_9PLEO|nr:asparaginyl-tRNA synthetase [Dothidotthia symphoricarpi CBS 119687]KAF2129947.1 asparaginyl-tRNA synthetase [Dothidotthia symphoricarpi CBS 119687]
MSWMLIVRRSAVRPNPLLPHRGAASYIRATPLCCPRYSSTFCPTNIAELLKSSSQHSSSSPRRGLSDGETLTVNGYVRTVRKQKRVAFAAIGDGSTLQSVQAVLSPQLAEGLSTGVAVAATGRWIPSPGQDQSHELQVENIRILGENDAATSPIQKKYQTPEYLRTLPHLRPRLPFNALLLRLRSLVTAQVTNYFAKQDFVQCHPPIITSSDCEGAGEVFTVAPGVPSTQHQGSSNQAKEQEDMFFGSPKYLTVSSQLHLEALAQSVNKVWTLSPTFRAEKSDTARHLSEFYMLEAELAFVDDMKDVMDVVEGMLRALGTELQSSHVGRELLDARARELNDDDTSVSHSTLAQRWQGLIDGPWPRITYHDAIQHLKDAVDEGKTQFDFAPGHEDGLQTEHERFLAESIGRGSPIFVTDYPRNIKPFYMAPSTDPNAEGQADPTVACFDLLVPEICELAGGSMREHRLPELVKAMEEHGLQQPVDLESEVSDGSLQCYEALPPNFSLSANMLAGAFAGIAEHSVMYPVDLLKTRMQVVNPSPTAMYTGISNAMVTISRVEGITTLWRGLSSVIMGAGPAHAVYFASYESAKHALGGNEGGSDEHHPFAAAASGAAATISSDALMNPFDVIKQRMQLHGSIYKSVPHCAREVFRTEGLAAFYVSYPTTLCMTVPFTALQFMSYESLSKVMNPTGRYDPYTHCFAGGIAGGFAAGLTTPLDVIKTLLQTRGNARDAELRNVSGLLQAAKIINQREGWRGYFRGLKPRIITTMPSTAICWSAYEMAKAFFIARSTDPTKFS